MSSSFLTPSIERLEVRTLLDGSLPGVPDVEGQFAQLKHHAEAIGWILPEGVSDPDTPDDNAPDPSLFDHYQGVVRYPGAGTPVFYVTQKDDDDNGVNIPVPPNVPPPPPIFNGGYLHVVSMGSRDTDGERLRSNLQRVGADTEDTSPAASDTWVNQFHLDGQSGVIIDGQPLRGYIHPGGMAIEDNVLLVGMDTPDGPGVGSTGEIVLFDLGENGENRLAPVPIQALDLSHTIDNLAITLIGEEGNQNNPLRYLIWTNGGGGSEIHVYETNVPDLRDPQLAINHVQTWNPFSPDDFNLPGLVWPSGAGAHQSSTFIRQFDGPNPPTDAPLYMIGMRRSGLTPLTGEDRGDLYRVDVTVTGGFSHVKLTFVDSTHFNTEHDTGGHMGNFAAGSGGYVSPTGELILYNIPHDDQDGFDPDVVRMAEIRHRDVNREGSPLRLPTANAGGSYSVNEGGSVVLNGTGALPADKPWVEFYDDTDFDDRSIVIDFQDRSLFELNDFHQLDGFDNADHDNGRASSVRWRAPIGVDIHLFGGANFTATEVILRGTGRTEEVADLEDDDVDVGRIEFVGKNDGDQLEFGDSTSSMRFIGAPPGPSTLEFDWDLDGDGIFGETGAAAANGNELGASPTFIAGTLDGPASYNVSLRVVDSFGALAISTTTVTVNNIAPAAGVTGDTFGVPGLPRNFNLSATDPSAADTAAGFIFAVSFDDGNNTVVNPGGLLLVQHTYLAEGIYTVTVTATDKDGGTSTPATHQIEIKAAGILPDPTDPTKTALFVGGTLGNDVIKIIQKGKTGNYEVTINGQSKGVFAPTGRIIIFGQAGNDSIDVPGSVALPVEMYGGEGNDSMSGGSGPDLIVGDAGNDVLAGGQGRDILIGGSGVDQLNGNADDDVLVGSGTIHDSNFNALHAIQAEWLRTDIAASVRSSHLLDGTGLNGPSAKLNAASILDDGLADVLAGASGDNFIRQ